MSGGSKKKTLNLPGGATVQLDGCNQAEKVACEAFARQGKMNPGQKRKLGNDILKLLLVERRLGGAWRKILVVAGPGWRRRCHCRADRGSLWRSASSALKFSPPLDAALSTEILAAQGLQVMTNVTNLGM